MEIRKFKPGELICRMSKRSKLNSLFHILQEQQSTRLMEDMEIAKAMANMENGDPGSPCETVISGFVKSLTTHKTHNNRPVMAELLELHRQIQEVAGDQPIDKDTDENE